MCSDTNRHSLNFNFMSTNGECIYFSLARPGDSLTLSVFQWLLDHLTLLMFTPSTSLLHIWFHLINSALKMRWKSVNLNININCSMFMPLSLTMSLSLFSHFSFPLFVLSSPSFIHPVLDGNTFTRQQNKNDCYY